LTSRTKLLLIEDDQIDQLAFERTVRRQNLPYDYTIAGSVAQAHATLAEATFDIILADYLLGDGTVFDLFDDMQDTPFIILTGSGDEDIAVRAMKAGAYDYVTKDPEGNYLTTLPLTVEHAIERWQNEQELERYRARLEALVEERTQALQESEQRYRTIFQTVPVSVWEEDFSQVVEMLEALKVQGITDIRAYLDAHPEFVKEAADNIWIRDVNDATLALYEAESKDQLLGKFSRIISSGTLDLLREELVAIATGQTHFEGETTSTTLQGNHIDILVTMRLTHFDSVLVSIVDITERKQMEDALRQSEERYRTIFETTGTATILIEEDMTISLANHQCEVLSGYTREEIEGKKRWTEFVVPQDLEQMRRYHHQRRNKPQAIPSHYDFHLIDKDGDVHNVYLSIALIPGTTQSIASILDITDRVRAEQALEKRVAHLGLINEIGAQIAAVLDLDRLLERAALLIQETFGYYHVGLFLLDRQKKGLNLHSKAGEFADLYARDHRLEVGQGMVGWVAEHKKRLLVNDVTVDDRYVNLYPDTVPTGAELSVPLQVGDELTGVLDVQSPQRNAFNTNDILVLETLADQIAVAIENAKLHENLQQELNERKRAETALRESRRRLATLMSNLPGMAYRCQMDSNWTMEFVSEGGTALTGYAPEDLIDNRVIAFNDLIHPEDRVQVRENIDRALQERRPFQLNYRIIKADGEQRWVWEQGRGVPNDQQGPPQFLEGFITDITERKRAETEREEIFQQLQEQTQRLQQIMDTVSEGMLLLDADKRILLANPVAKSYLATLGNADLDNVLHTLGSRPIEELLTAPPQGLWHEIKTENRIFEVTAKSLISAETPAGWTLVVRDVTREREMQQRMQQQERLAAVGQLAAGIAHDFNNIMAVIILYGDMLLRSVTSSQEKDRVKTIMQQANRAADLIEQLLDFSRRAVFERRLMDLTPFLKEQVKLYERTLPDNIDVHMLYDAADHTVNADPTRIQQVIMNLVVNARDAMPSGGNLYIEVERLTIAEEDTPVPNMTPGDWILLNVRDTGTGMSDDVRSHLFEPFFTTKAPGAGSGLGLAQAYGIVKQHEGEITVTTEENQGTTFHIYLPALKTQTQDTWSGRKADTLPHGQQELILVVEDNSATRGALVNSLDLLNYRTLEAANGREALDVLAQHADIDLVLTDMIMREMGGLELVRALEKKGLDLPIILLSGYPRDQKMEDLRALNLLYTWLSKPVDLQDLAQTLRDTLR
jgi:two-component system, cell cycle sensor histidine kinase and response regulator CckA